MTTYTLTSHDGIGGDRLHKHYNRDEDFVVDGYTEVATSDYEEFTEKCKSLGLTKGGVAKMLIAEWLAGMRNGEERRWRPKKQDPKRQKTTA